MKITLMQTDIIWDAPRENMKKNDERLSAVGETDLVVFPEMFSTGFTSSPETDSEKSGETLVWMKKKSKERGFAICGSVSVEDGGSYYNRFYFVTPDGMEESYDKIHLFSFAGESRSYIPGDRRKIVEYKGMRILLQTCYDLRFPETSRNSLGPDGVPAYDIALYIASWPARRNVAWTTLLRARAIENQCYVIGVNRVGNDPSCSYSGESAAFDPIGRQIASCPSGEDCFATATADPIYLNAFREEFPVLRDIRKTL